MKNKPDLPFTRSWKAVLPATCLLVLAACAPVVTPPTMDNQEAPDTPTTTFTFLPTETPTSTPTRTSLPSQTPLPTWTFLPTLGDFRAEVELHSWYQGNPDCRFPCWAGITPDKTTWEEAVQIMRPVVDINSINLQRCTYGLCDYLEWEKRGDVFVRGAMGSDKGKNTIVFISVNFQETTPPYRVDKILGLYGPPERVFIWTEYHGLDPYMLSFDLTLAYPSQHFIVQYLWWGHQSGDNVVACIQDKLTKFIISKFITDQWSDDQLIEDIYGVGDYDKRYIRPLEEVTSMSISDFYEEFKDVSGDECITTPGQYWP